MKILFYSDSAERGGAEKYLDLLADGLRKKGHNISVSQSVGELKTVLQAERPDLIHFNLPDAYACGEAIEAALTAGSVRTFATIHSLSRSPALKTGSGFKRFVSLYFPFWGYIDALRGELVFRIKRRSVSCRLSKIDRVIAVSEASKNEIVRMFGLKPQNLSVIYNGVEPKTYPENAEARRTLGLGQNELVVACLGRLVKNKGQEVFLRAAVEIKNKVRDIKFLIVGDGYLKEYLERLSERLGLSENVIFLDYEKSPWVFGAMDVSVVPSLSETFSFAVAESMLAGKPVVASEVGGIPELVKDGETGLLVKANDPHELAEEVLKLKNDHRLAEVFGRKGEESVLKIFSFERMISETEKAYKER